MDTNMEDAGSPPEDLTSDADVDMDEADPLRPGYVRRNPNVINLVSDDGNFSDSTLLEDEIVQRVVTPVSEARRIQRQSRSRPASFGNLQTYTQNGCTFRVGRTTQGPDGNFLRIVSIKQHRASGAVTIESFQDNHRTLQTYSYDGRTLKSGKTVEMMDGAFLRIKTILQDRRTGEILLKGFRFQRNRSLEGLLELKVNEVTFMMKYDPDNHHDMFEQSIETVKLAAVVTIRELIKTNQKFPALSFRETDPASLASSIEHMSAHCRLVCRWKYLKTSKNEGFLKRLMDVESDEGCSVPQAQLRSNFRGRTIKGGVCPGWLDEEVAFERVKRMRSRGINPLDFQSPNRNINEAATQRYQRRYTLFDAYSGGGGVSSGAQMAGLRVEGAFDHDPNTVATYRLNFPQTSCECISAYDFAISTNGNYKIDILHMSPPCPPFSPHHTRPFPNDERNQATFLATETLLVKTTPRIVTLEQTFGLTRTEENREWFKAMIHMFTKLGFSIRWKVFNLMDFGLPQPRKRLFIFASCPGETLPDFPESTHCKAEDVHRFSHRSRYTTVEDAIGRIPRDFPDHGSQLRAKFNKRPYSSNLRLRNTICCSGSLSYHPSGKRCFTTRELACLNGFTLTHRFSRGARKQIGNAVPPIAAKVFFEQVVRALRKADGL